MLTTKTSGKNQKRLPFAVYTPATTTYVTLEDYTKVYWEISGAPDDNSD